MNEYLIDDLAESLVATFGPATKDYVVLTADLWATVRGILTPEQVAAMQTRPDATLVPLTVGA